jgi:hypothetical protein
LDGVAEVHVPLGEGLVAGDEEGFVGGRAAVPLEVFDGVLDDRAAILFAPVGPQAEQHLGHPVQVAGEGQDLPQVLFPGREAGISVFVERDFNAGGMTPAAGAGQVVHDAPEL